MVVKLYIPKSIRKKIELRRRAAEKYLEYDYEIAKWVDEKGFDSFSNGLEEVLNNSILSICEPTLAESKLIEILEKL